jgi:hypothetical protein
VTKSRLEQLKPVLKMVAEDVEQDATDFDGKPFTGKVVAEYMGNHGAAIQAVANALLDSIEYTQQLEARITNLEGSNDPT